VGSVVIACYRPKEGREQELLAAVRDHRAVLEAEDLITDRPWLFLRGADGHVLEVFEWRSDAAIASAHESPSVRALWERFEAACEYVPLGELPEASTLFANFEPFEP
jgi:hypothetical protein